MRQKELERSHNVHILPMLSELYEEANIERLSTELVAFGAGPGSFTGVRIAASVAQGIAMANSCKVVPVRGSQVLIQSAAADPAINPHLRNSQITQCIVFIPSRADAYYVSLYEKDGEQIRPLIEDELLIEPTDWMRNLVAEYARNTAKLLRIIGTLPTWVPCELNEWLVGNPIPDARVMISLARRQYLQGAGYDAEYAIPFYVKGDSPWRKNS